MSLTNYAPEVGVMKLGGIEIRWSFDVWLRNFWLMCLNLSVLKPEKVCCSRTWQLSRASEVFLFPVFQLKIISWKTQILIAQAGWGWRRWWSPLVLDPGVLDCPLATPLWVSLLRGLDMLRQQVGQSQKAWGCRPKTWEFSQIFSFFTTSKRNSQFFNVLGKNWVN